MGRNPYRAAAVPPVRDPRITHAARIARDAVAVQSSIVNCQLSIGRRAGCPCQSAISERSRDPDGHCPSGRNPQSAIRNRTTPGRRRKRHGDGESTGLIRPRPVAPERRARLGLRSRLWTHAARSLQATRKGKRAPAPSVKHSTERSAAPYSLPVRQFLNDTMGQVAPATVWPILDTSGSWRTRCVAAHNFGWTGGRRGRLVRIAGRQKGG